MIDLPDLPVSNVLFRYFDKTIVQSSPLKTDYVRTVNYDEKHGEIITYEPFDSRKYQESLGEVDNWGLNSLLKAGINPDFSIHTSSPSRIDGASAIKQFEDAADEFVKDINKE